MDQIAASHITFTDLLICGGAIVLLLKLLTSPPNSATCRVVALLCGGMVVTLVLLLLLVGDLSDNAVKELAFVAIGLCVGLWKWNDRVKSARVIVTAVRLQPSHSPGCLSTTTALGVNGNQAD